MKKYIVTLSIGIIFAFLIMLSKNIFAQTDSVKIMHILTDSFFVPGVIITGFGLLVIASNGGTFDMLSYGVMKFISFFKRNMKTRYDTYYDYRTAQHESPKPYMYLLISGIILILISMLFLILYYNI